MWDRERKFSELIDDKIREFFQDVVEKTCIFPWSLWEKEGLILSAKRMETSYPETALGPRMAEWFQLKGSGENEQPDHFETEKGLCLVFPVRYEIEVVGAMVISPTAEKNDLSQMQAMGKLLAGLTELILCSNLKQALMMDAHRQIMAFSYEEVVQRNRELEESEGRYRELAESLEVKVVEKTAELKTAYLRLLHADKMASVGQLAAGVAHEINNPLAFVKSNINGSFQMIGDLVEKIKVCRAVSAGLGDVSDPRLQPLKEIFAGRSGQDLDDLMKDFESLITETLEGIARVQKIVSDLKEFSHIDEGEVSILDMHRSLDTTLSVLQHHLKPGTRVSRHYGDDMPPIKCNPQQIAQVLMSILLNAIQAIDNDGEITVRTSLADGMVQIETGDTGCGIPPENLSRIFDPFFTTKPVGQGTGTGLSVCYNVIKAHGGTIEAKSEVGKGTAITITLPV